MKKIRGSISYPRRLEFGPNVHYRLRGIVVHWGSLEHGHYIAVVNKPNPGSPLDESVSPIVEVAMTQEIQKPVKKEIDQKSAPIAEKKRKSQWYYCNDKNISECDEKVALSQEAYLLFYERIHSQDNEEVKSLTPR